VINTSQNQGRTGGWGGRKDLKGAKIQYKINSVCLGYLKENKSVRKGMQTRCFRVPLFRHKKKFSDQERGGMKFKTGGMEFLSAYMDRAED